MSDLVHLQGNNTYLVNIIIWEICLLQQVVSN